MNVGKTLFARVMECVPWDRLLATQLELVTPVLQVVQRLPTRHLLAAAGLVADEGHGRAVTLVQRFGFTAHLNIHLHGLVLDGGQRCRRQFRAIQAGLDQEHCALVARPGAAVGMAASPSTVDDVLSARRGVRHVGSESDPAHHGA